MLETTESEALYGFAKRKSGGPVYADNSSGGTPRACAKNFGLRGVKREERLARFMEDLAIHRHIYGHIGKREWRTSQIR